MLGSAESIRVKIDLIPVGFYFLKGHYFSMVARSAICAWVLIFVAVCGAMLPMHNVQAQPSSTTGSNSPLNFYGDGFVLLQHGAVIHGFIKPQADSVTVVMDKGKQVTLVKKQILFIVPTMQSLYK
ncbi:MAG: hypothetical protein ACK6AT_10590 [Planctomycetota bacterium]